MTDLERATSDAKAAIIRKSPFGDVLGIRVVDWAPGIVVLEFTIQQHLRNYVGTLHGGVLCAAADMAGTLSGCFTPHSESNITAVTLSLTTNFIASVSEGTVRVVGRRRGGRKTFSASIDIFVGDLLIGVAQGTFRHV